MAATPLCKHVEQGVACWGWGRPPIRPILISNLSARQLEQIKLQDAHARALDADQTLVAQARKDAIDRLAGRARQAGEVVLRQAQIDPDRAAVVGAVAGRQVEQLLDYPLRRG